MLSIFITVLAILTMLVEDIIAFKIREDLTYLDFVALVLIHKKQIFDEVHNQS